MARVVMEVDTPDGRATMADLTVGEGGKISQHEGVDVPLTMKSDGRRGLALVRPIGEFVQLTAQNRMDSGFDFVPDLGVGRFGDLGECVVWRVRGCGVSGARAVS